MKKCRHSTSNLSGEEGEWSVYFAYTKLNDFSCLNEAIVKLIGHIIQKSEGFDWGELEDDYVTKSLEFWSKESFPTSRIESPELCLEKIQFISLDLKSTPELERVLQLLYQQISLSDVTLIFETDHDWHEYNFIAHNSEYVFLYYAGLNC